MKQSKERPYVLYVAEIIYSQIFTIKKKNRNARAAKGSLLSTIGFVVMKAEDHNKIKING